MTKKFNKEIYKADNSIFSGEITIEDFSTTTPNKNRINNQIEAIKQSKQRKEAQKYKHMTLEELREMRIISNTNGTPSPALTDTKWQKEFNVRKLFIKPYDKNVKKLKGKYARETSKWNEETHGTYYGQTNWQQYCNYINDVLRNIRSGQVDYCYYIYQIEDLLKFHYNDLNTKYRDGYWEVWLERK